MNYKLVLFSIFVCSMFVFSCSNENRESSAEDVNTSTVLQGNEINIRKYSRSGDMIEELYSELVENTPELKKLESDLALLNDKRSDTLDVFDQYNGRSNNYYSSAGRKSSSITDSILRKKIMKIIALSHSNYSDKTKELTGLIEKISINKSTLNDHHEVMKIMLTLPVIEKYQNANKPNADLFKNVIKEQDRLIHRMDSITPKD